VRPALLESRRDDARKELKASAREREDELFRNFLYEHQEKKKKRILTSTFTSLHEGKNVSR